MSEADRRAPVQDDLPRDLCCCCNSPAICRVIWPRREHYRAPLDWLIVFPLCGAHLRGLEDGQVRHKDRMRLLPGGRMWPWPGATWHYDWRTRQKVRH